MNDQEKALVKSLVEALEGMKPSRYEKPIDGSGCFTVETIPAHFGERDRNVLEAGKRFLSTGELPVIHVPRTLGVIRCPECSLSREGWQDSDGFGYFTGLRDHLKNIHGHDKKSANKITHATHPLVGRV